MPWDAVMGKFKRGSLKSSSGQKVTNPMQAVAIEYSEKKAAKGGKKEYQSTGMPLGESAPVKPSPRRRK